MSVSIVCLEKEAIVQQKKEKEAQSNTPDYAAGLMSPAMTVCIINNIDIPVQLWSFIIVWFTSVIFTEPECAVCWEFNWTELCTLHQ